MRKLHSRLSTLALAGVFFVLLQDALHGEPHGMYWVGARSTVGPGQPGYGTWTGSGTSSDAESWHGKAERTVHVLAPKGRFAGS